MIKENYIYPVKVKKIDGGYEAEICDFDTIPAFGESQEELLHEMQEIIALKILELSDKNINIPEPSEASDMSLEEGENLFFVHLWMPYFKNFTKEVYVKKTLTIPQWLDILGKENEVNFSAILTKALKEELGINKK